MTALLRRIDQAVDTCSLARATLVLAPFFAAALSAGSPLWMYAALVSASAFIAMEKSGHTPLGVALHGPAIGAGFLLLAAIPVSGPVRPGRRRHGRGDDPAAAKGHKLRTLGNFTFIPALYPRRRIRRDG